jgi:hypothetical protein
VAEQLDWLVIVRVRADCRRRYRRACSCRVPATATAPGPPKAIGKGLFTNAFIAMLFTERFVAGRSMNSLVTGLARHGADVAPGTLAGPARRPGRCSPRWRTRSARPDDNVGVDQAIGIVRSCDFQIYNIIFYCRDAEL